MNSTRLKLIVLIQSIFFVLLISCTKSNAQIVREWEYSFNPPANLEAAGNCIIHLDQGLTISGGNYKSITSPYTRNTLLFTGDSGTLMKADTSTLGFGFSKIIYGGYASYFALAAMQNDSNPARNILIAKIDSVSLNVNYFVPDSSPNIYYDPADMVLLSSGRLVVGSRMDNFPLIRLSFTCLENSGNVIWQTTDSTFEIKYDLKLIADESGGFYASGTGRDISTSDDFIFISHFDNTGTRDWFQRQDSPIPSFADFLDLILDESGHLWISGVLMDSIGQVGILMKFDTLGNQLWKHTVMPHPYQKILSDENNFVYGAAVPSNGLDVFTIDKLDSSGNFLYSTNFQLTGYFNSILYDFKMLEGGIIAATGDLYVLSFPKSDLYLAIYDTALNLVDHNIYNSVNFLGESGRAVVQGADDEVFVCGRLNYENQLETCNLGIIKYNLQIFDEIQEANVNGVIDVFPNPSNGNVVFKWDNFSTGKFQLSIYNIIGEQVFGECLNGKEGQLTLELHLGAGLYLLKIKSAAGSFSRKLFIINE